MNPDRIWHAERVIWSGRVVDECMKNSGGGMTSILGSRGTFIRSLFPEDDGGGEGLKGDTEGLGKLPRVQEITGEEVNGYTITKPARRSKGISSTGWRRGNRGKRS